MAEIDRIQEDLEYVKGAVQQHDRSRGYPMPVNLLWGCLILIGFPLNDFAPHLAGWYWLVAGPLGGVASAVLAIRGARRAGQVMPRQGPVAGLHWGGMGAAMLLLFLCAYLGNWPGQTTGQAVLLVVGLAYYLAGVHIDRCYVIPGAGMIIGAAAAAGALHVEALQHFFSTVLGVVVGGSLIVGTLVWRRPHAQ